MKTQISITLDTDLIIRLKEEAERAHSALSSYMNAQLWLSLERGENNAVHNEKS